MRIFLVAALIVGAFITFDAKAQERAGDAALGAVSGAVVLGPVGAVAGAIVGFTAGPAISRSWSTRGSSPRARAQRTPQQANAANEPQTTASVAPAVPPRSSQAVSLQPPASAKPPPSAMPPVQSLE